ncbi:MAG: hypothetical protein AMXMBFR12_07430 [Candidatus Babeliales bacterium]
MKYILSLLMLLSFHYSFSLFYCFKKAEQHIKLKDEVDAEFLDQGINKPQSITLHLHNPDDHPERIIARSIPEKFFKKSAEWKFEIRNDQNNCIEINDLLIHSGKNNKTKDKFQVFSWNIQPKRTGMALVRATYTAPYRKNNPYIQEFVVSVE